MQRLLLWGLSVVLLAGCQPLPLVRVSLGDVPETPPVIDKVIDLGGVLTSDAVGLNRSESDELFIAGEWVAVTGTGLNGSDTRLLLDGAEIPIAGGLKHGGLLFRVPATVRFRHTYNLKVVTPRGSSETTLPVSNLLVMADTRADQVVVWKSSADAENLFDDAFVTLPCRRAGPAAVNPGGGLLYVLAGVGKTPGNDFSHFELKTLHLAAKGGPKELATLAFEARQVPLALVVSATTAQAYLLTARDLVRFDLADPEHPAFAGRFELPAQSAGPGYGDLVLLADGRRGAIVDEAGAQLLLMDLAAPAAPVLLGSFKVNRSAEAVFLPIALALDPSNPNTLLVLAGLNAHQVGLHLSSLWSEKNPELPTTRSALIRMTLAGDQLLPEAPQYLPDGVLPFGLFAEQNGDVLVSAVAFEKGQLGQTDLSLKGASSLVKGLWNSLFAGRIYRLQADGTVKLESKSVNLPLALDRIEGSPLVYSAYRLNIRYVPPSASVVLAVDVQKQQSLPVRAMEWTAIFPPYRFFPSVTLL